MLAVCATPIGNLEDVTLRVLRELGEADLVLCEDTRRTKILLERHGIEAKLLSYHEHNEAERTAQVLPRLASGERIALTSDAGLPGVSDPGARLIAAALEAGVPVTVLPGASAVETATRRERAPRGAVPVPRLPAAGREGACRSSGRSSAVGRMLRSRSSRRRRLPASLASLAARWPERSVAVCRELTKRFEEVVRGTAAEVAAQFAEPPKGEITVVFGGATALEGDEGEALAALSELVEAGARRRQAADVVSRLTGIPRNRLYRGSL